MNELPIRLNILRLTEAGPSYNLDILSEVHDHDHYQDAVCEHHEVHEMHEDVQPNYIVDSHAEYTSDSNMIPYDQYVKDNIVLVVQSNVSSAPNDAYMMILNDMHEQPAQHVSITSLNNVVDKSLAAKLATYKEQVELVNLGKLQPTADIRIFVGYALSRKGPAPMFLTPGQISSVLVPDLVPAAPYVLPTHKDLEILFQPMFDEYLEPPRIERPVSPTLAVPFQVNIVSTPSSTTIDQDAPCPSHSPSSSVFQCSSLLQGVAAESTIMKDNPLAPIDNDPFVNVFAPEPSSEASSSRDLSSVELTYITHTHYYLGK
nr:hypothetical protein [Tanacetum cinerariifolium]